MKKITISREDYDNILDAWAKTNVLVGYFAHPNMFTQKYSASKEVNEIYKHLSDVIDNLPDIKS